MSLSQTKLKTFDLYLPARFREALPRSAIQAGSPLPGPAAALCGYLDGAVATPVKVRAWLRHLLPEEASIRISDRGTVTIRLGGDELPALSFAWLDDHESLTVPVCVLCGCTGDLKCWGGKGCSWVMSDVCSHCEERYQLRRAARLAAEGRRVENEHETGEGEGVAGV